MVLQRFIFGRIVLKIFLTYFLLLMIHIIHAMRMITPVTVQAAALMMSFRHCKILLRTFLSGFPITKLEETLRNVIFFRANAP